MNTVCFGDSNAYGYAPRGYLGGHTAGSSYQQISQKKAKGMMDTQEVIILNVQEQDEYDSGHIPGAVLLPAGTIDAATAAAVIPSEDAAAGILPQREPQQNRILGTGRSGLHQYL